eukprot:TRINITY_DN6478_c0_g1_i1.p1 TRINITY_DN6478_c0_g1~~TRINITY_DN6478_c0_g1_i1.p1  ORF type:complete len:124 (-),score=21.35 TRINITY_DN6478_c0_g1_i1:8-346(-)
MTWPDGFTIESDNWVEDSFEEVQKEKLHPKIQEAMDNQTCTANVTDEFHLIPQLLHLCGNICYCFPCLAKGCCGCGAIINETYWYWQMDSSEHSCECEREECKIKTKKPRLE